MQTKDIIAIVFVIVLVGLLVLHGKESAIVLDSLSNGITQQIKTLQGNYPGRIGA